MVSGIVYVMYINIRLILRDRESDTARLIKSFALPWNARAKTVESLVRLDEHISDMYARLLRLE